MAATWIKPIHINKAWGAAQTVKHCLDYAMNPDKTNGGELVSGYECDPQIAADEFMFTKDEYFLLTRRESDGEILVYHVRQAFKPGEINPETSHRLGHELAMELTGGKNAYIVATHDDLAHIHNHIIINAYDLDCERKYKNPIRSYKKLRQLTDRICVENGLSIIENPGQSKSRPREHRYENPTKRSVFVEMIDAVLDTGKPKDFDDFLRQLGEAGCEIKRRGNTVSVKPPKAKRFFRFRAGQKGLPDGYDEAGIKKRIAEIHAAVIYEETRPIPPEIKNAAPSIPELPPVPQSRRKSAERKIGLVIDIENSLKAKDSPAYQKWARKFNLQQAAETLLFLQQNNLTDFEILSQTARQAAGDYANFQRRIDAANVRMKEITVLQKHIGTYSKTKDIYSQYLRSKRSPDFYAKNENAINACAEAKAFFDSLPYAKLPSIKELQAEYAALISEKNKCYAARREMKQHVLDLQSAKQNAELLLGIAPELERTRNKKQTRETDL